MLQDYTRKSIYGQYDGNSKFTRLSLYYRHQSIEFMRTTPKIYSARRSTAELRGSCFPRPESPVRLMSDLSSQFIFETFSDESDLDHIIKLVEKDLSEPYSIYTYRFFIYDFPRMCILVRIGMSYFSTNAPVVS